MVGVGNAIHQVCSSLHLSFNQEWDILGRLLQVVIHGQYPHSARLMESTNGGIVLSKIFPQSEKSYSIGIFMLYINQYLPAIVLGEIVDENYFIFFGNILENSHDPISQLRKGTFTVKDRNDD